MQTVNNWESLHRSNIESPENRKLYISKHLYESRIGIFKIMPVFKIDDYTLLQIKGKEKLHR